MTDQTPDWPSIFQYATDDLSTSGDGYWLFAPMLTGEIELFQVSTMVVGEMVEEFATTVVTPAGVRRHATHGMRGETPTPDQRAVRHADRFLLEAGPLLTISSDAPDREYRVQTNDPVNGVSADLRVTPATFLHWDIERSNYRTTLDSHLEGTITIDGTAHEVSTLCAFEHSSWPVAAPGAPPLPKAMPPFWHYEYIQWSGADEPFGTFLWHSLGNEGEKVQASEFHASSPAHTNASMFDSYEIVYKDIDDHDGRMLPRGLAKMAQPPSTTAICGKRRRSSSSPRRSCGIPAATSAFRLAAASGASPFVIHSTPVR